MSAPLRLGIAGLGQGGQRIVSAALRHPKFAITAGADPDKELREEFARTVPCEVHSDIASLIANAGLDVVYIATPTPLHAEHTLAALGAGKHVIVEKPMAVSLSDADAMVAAAESAGLVLLVGHSQSFEPPIVAMREIVASGELGPLRMMQTTVYTDWLYRPRRPDELETALGGGVIYRQAAHQFDILRWIGGGMVRSVRASIGGRDPGRAADGSYAAFIEFESGVSATATYSGYDHFQTTEFTEGVGEDGRRNAYMAGAARKALELAGRAGEPALKRSLAAAASPTPPPEFASTFGSTIVSCEGGDIRQVLAGLRIYSSEGERIVPIGPTPTGRDLMLDEAYNAIVSGQRAPHDGRWGRATLELCIAVLESARTQSEIRLRQQAPTPGG